MHYFCGRFYFRKAFIHPRWNPEFTYQYLVCMTSRYIGFWYYACDVCLSRGGNWLITGEWLQQTSIQTHGGHINLLKTFLKHKNNIFLLVVHFDLIMVNLQLLVSITGVCTLVYVHQQWISVKYRQLWLSPFFQY